jgi:hypothetical protein
VEIVSLRQRVQANHVRIGTKGANIILVLQLTIINSFCVITCGEKKIVFEIRGVAYSRYQARRSSSKFMDGQEEIPTI